ncbi:ABC transporter permease [Nocardia terpenica]|uniref:Transport permease protein n=1 Tax=Nocardia terpenica TaxID=455432 RepID=A0A164IYC2_9NOCA|nr:ABC transporter permease [Nocardia terpenica]KZM69856.1 ABC transporter [Nocardia terpenica]NQE91211.1 ABC transporter permease [Nocardia terpenica]
MTAIAARVPRVDHQPRITHIGPCRAARQSLVVALRGLMTFRRSPQMLFDAALMPIIGPILFGNIFGAAIAGGLHGYLPTLIPGVLVQMVLGAAVTTGVQLCEDVRSGVHDRFTAMPVARVAPVAGLLTASVTRYVLSATILVIVGFAMGYRPKYPVGFIAGAVLVVFVTAALSWIFAFVGILVSKPATVQGISALVLMFVTFASNALVPTAVMAPWLRRVSDINPVSHLISAVRVLAGEGRFGADAGWTVLAALAVVLVFAPMTLRALRPR